MDQLELGKIRYHWTTLPNGGLETAADVRQEVLDLIHEIDRCWDLMANACSLVQRAITLIGNVP